MKIRENVPLSELTTMRLGGPARYVVEVESVADVAKVYEFADGKITASSADRITSQSSNVKVTTPRFPGSKATTSQPSDSPRTLSDGRTTISTTTPLEIYPLGGGANSIGRDEGFDGIIILNRLKGIEVLEETEDGALVRAAGGEIWDDFVAFCCDREYSGVEAMSGIPGLVGSAPVQNIGAYGQELSNVLDSVEAYDRQTGEMVILNKSDLKMGYRSTIFNTGKDKNRYFITAIIVELENREFLRPPFYASLQAYLAKQQNNGHVSGDATPQAPASARALPEIEDRPYAPNEIRAAVLAVRGSKLPDPAEKASAGSFFKNIYLSADEAEKAREKGLKVYEKSDGRFMINSGYLIEACGLSGQLLHGIRINDKAALVLINESAKNYADLAKARAEIRAAVKEKFGYDLEQEPVEIV